MKLDTPDELALMILKNGIGAFIGSFFALLFARLAEILKTIYDKKVAGHNANGRAERLLIFAMDDLSNTMFCADAIIKLRDDLNKPGPAPISYNKLVPINFSSDIPGIPNLRFINDLALLESELKRINITLVTLNDSYAEMKEAFLAGKINEPTYRHNFRIYVDGVAEGRKFMLDAKKSILRLNAITRILGKKKPGFTSFLLWITNKEYPTDDDVRNKIESIEKELSEASARNAERIKKISNAS